MPFDYPLSLVIVEDEPIMLEELVKAVPWQEIGVEVAGTAMDGVAGEALIKELNPDIVVTDINLPRQDGLAMVAACPMLYHNVVVLSGLTDFTHTRKAIQLGVHDYLSKPVDDDELLEVVGKMAARLRSDIAKARMEDKAGRFELASRTQNRQVNSVISFIERNYSSPIGLNDAAREVSLSPGHLSKIFKEATGVNWVQYLTLLRLNKAIALMEDTNLNINEIGAKVGVPEAAHFSKLFRRYLGSSPRAWRERPRT